MQKKLYKTGFLNRQLLIAVVFCLSGSALFQRADAQNFCPDEVVYWLENFGTGTTATSHPDIIPGTFTFNGSGLMTNEGEYRVVNNAQQRPEWHNSEDHTTGDTDGKMMVINGDAQTFFRHVTNLSTGFLPGIYSASVYVMNVNTPGTCAPNPLLPNVVFSVEYLDQNNNWIPVQGSPWTSGTVPQSADPAWVKIGNVFTLPPTGAFIVTNMRVTLASTQGGGCGNDYAIDDIKLASCPSGGQVPVIFETVSAAAKGSGVLVSWSTSTEINNDHYEVERSTDGGRSWLKIATVKGRGNSNTLVNYQSFDARPVIGRNLYRIRQVDVDGTAKYSVTVSANVKAGSTAISLLSNPVGSQATLDFLSDRAQQVRVLINDISGKLISSQTVKLQPGSNRIAILLPDGLSQGLYIIQVADEQGNSLFREKFIKQ